MKGNNGISENKVTGGREEEREGGEREERGKKCEEREKEKEKVGRG